MEDKIKEHRPFAPVEFWMHTLKTVVVYPKGRDFQREYVRAKVDESRGLVGEGTEAITVAEMKAGTWIGERTLQLSSGATIVFSGSH